jgi:hypothetical protein
MKKMFIVAICLLGISAVQAQSMGSDYKTALGFKVYLEQLVSSILQKAM